ncbi:MAG: choice-of-anchor Q domain-containing protein [Sumerlaeia bacterium]
MAAPNIDMRLSNSLLLSDSSSTEPLISAAFHSLGHNIITSYDSTATTLTATDRVGLTASEVVETTVTLAGGTTPTLRLLPFSPAVNAGDPAWVGTIGATDQRGAPRVAGGRIDIGAYELQAPTGAPAFWLGDLDGANDPLPGYSNDPAILLTFPLQGDEEEPAWLDVWSSDLPGTPTLLASHPDGEATAVLTVSGPDGEKHLAGRLVNAVGASDAVATAVVVLDRVPPRGQLAYPQTPAPRPGVGATVIEIAADGPADGTGSPVARHEVAARWLGSPGGEFAAVGDLLTSPSLPLWPDRAGTYVLRSELTDGAGNRVQTLHDDRPVTFDGDIQRPYKKGVATPHRRGVATPVHQNK